MPAEIGKTLLDAAQSVGVDVSAICGGVGTCGKCEVVIRQGAGSLDALTDYETLSFSEDRIGAGYRLACQAKVVGSGTVVVEIPLESRGSRYRLQVEGLETPVQLNPSVTGVELEVAAPSLQSVVSFHDALMKAALAQGLKLEETELECLLTLGDSLRIFDWKVQAVTYDGRRLMKVARPGAPILGMAFDIGTTKLAGYLVDLKTGRLLAKTSEVNPQVVYGEDVMSRLTYLMRERDGLSSLVRVVRSTLNSMIGEACKIAGASREDVEEVVLVGNTLMHHLALGAEPSSLGRAPYAPVISSSYAVEAGQVGIAGGQGCVAYFLPNVAGFVGADCVADVIATGLDKGTGNRLLVDIGTNTELVLAVDNELWGASSASGPAFEGAHIKHGMRAMSGAIEHVAIDEALNVRCTTVDGSAPVGICGSGVIDTVKELVHCRVVDTSGRMDDKSAPNLVIKGEDCLEFVLSGPAASGGRAVTFTQRDVREIQKAKGAIATGIKILLARTGVSKGSLEQVYVAGAFGTYIDLENAISIGMLPDVPLKQIKQVGNSAGTGARMCLLSKEAKKRADRAASKMKYIELATHAEFQDMYLGSLKLDRF